MNQGLLIKGCSSRAAHESSAAYQVCTIVDVHVVISMVIVYS